jgi:hypothetical protein
VASVAPVQTRGGAITITGDELQTAVADNVVTAEQADRLWDHFGHRASEAAHNP